MIETHSTLGRYETYLQMVEEMCRDCGFIPEREHLRIPSTKNIAILGRTRTFPIDKNAEILMQVDELTKGVVFSPRKSDKEKGELYRAKKLLSRIPKDTNTSETDLEFLGEFNLMEI
jgi:hypothetical protein